MAFDASKKDFIVGVAGTGLMGRGIVQVSAQGGMRVIAYDAVAGAADKAKSFIASMLARQVEKGSLGRADADATLARIEIATKLEDLAKANLIVEAVVERLDVKQELFAKLDALAGPQTIIASNTSSLPVTAIAARCQRQERIAGLHFFNPVPLMRLVEVIGGLRTAPWVTDGLMVIGRRMGREPVLCSDSPGFIVNHVGRAYNPEALRVLSERIASHGEIDRIMTGAPGFRMGPFTLMDLVGHDTAHASMESIFGQFYNEPAYAPSSLMALRVAGGMYGQKTGEGWYVYKDGKKQEPPVEPAPKTRAKSIHLRPSEGNPGFTAELGDLFRKSGIEVETAGKPIASMPTVLTQVGWDLTTAIVDLKLDAANIVAVDMLFGLKGPRTLMVTPATDPLVRDGVHAALAADGQQVVVINDSPGFIAQRLVAQIVNVGCNVAQRGIALPADIDKGAKLGLGYPFGPLEWGDRIGPKRVLHILERLAAFYGDPRYRPSPWLKRRALLGLPLTQPERAG